MLARRSTTPTTNETPVVVTSGHWQNFTSDALKDLDAEHTVAVLPVAAIEQHGPHLPLATDALIAAALVDGMLARLAQADASADRPSVLALPLMSVGHSLEHRDFPGTLEIAAHTLLNAWLDVAAAVVRCGVRKMAILNAHGGQTSLVDLAAIRLRADHGMLVARANYFDFGLPRELFEADELAHGLHGGEVETSIMLHLRPDLVHLDRAQDFDTVSRTLAKRHQLLGVEKPVGIGWMAQDLNPHGVCGNAANADAERGRKTLEHLCDRLVILIEELAATALPACR